MYAKLSALAESRTKEEWQELYDNHTLKEIGVMIGYSSDARVPVKKILNYHGIALRQRGRGPDGGNRKGTGLNIPEEVLRQKRTHRDIAKEYGCHEGTVRRFRTSIGIRRNRPYSDEWLEYNCKARNASEKTYRKHKHILNPDNLPRGKMGVSGAYQLDHIKPLRQCFDEGMPVEKSAALENLQFISWEDNLSRRKYE